MANDRLDVDAMARTLAEWLATGSDVTAEDCSNARDALTAMGVPDVVDALDMAERILRFGNSFHSIARFFVDGSAEQDYLLRLTGGASGSP